MDAQHRDIFLWGIGSIFVKLYNYPRMKSLDDSGISGKEGTMGVGVGLHAAFGCGKKVKMGFCFLPEGICSPLFLKHCPPLAGMRATAVSIVRQVKQMWCVRTVEY